MVAARKGTSNFSAQTRNQATAVATTVIQEEAAGNLQAHATTVARLATSQACAGKIQQMHISGQMVTEKARKIKVQEQPLSYYLPVLNAHSKPWLSRCLIPAMKKALMGKQKKMRTCRMVNKWFSQQGSLIQDIA